MEVLKVNLRNAGYKDEKRVIKDIQFTVKKGEVVGLIGSNGAGKSTTIKAILGILPEINGEVYFKDNNINYAYIPEQPILYENLTLWEHLEFVAAVHEMNRNNFLDKGKRLLDLFRLIEVKDKFPVTFSKGMQQKVMIVLGILIQPDIYIIDEPFVGLDPRGMLDFINLLKLESKRGAGILISTHQLDIAERMCDSIIFMSEGRIISQGKIKDLLWKNNQSYSSLFDYFYNFTEQKL